MTTDEWLQEYASSRGLTLRVDRTQSLIRGVKILGLESRNGRSYIPEALAAAAALYEGAKVNVNHPRAAASAPRDYQDRLGAIRGVSFRAGEGLFADLHYNPKHALAEQLAWDAEHAPEHVGLSHNVEARTAQREGRTVVEAILAVQSVDLVADPATTSGLFESTADTPALQAPSEAATVQEEASVALDEVTRLEQTVEQLRQAARRRERLDEAAECLRQHGLPSLDDPGPLAHRLLDEDFRAELAAAESRQTVVKLIEQREQLIDAAAAWQDQRRHATRPTSREQRLVDAPLLEAADARQFVDCISRLR